MAEAGGFEPTVGLFLRNFSGNWRKADAESRLLVPPRCRGNKAEEWKEKNAAADDVQNPKSARDALNSLQKDRLMALFRKLDGEVSVPPNRVLEGRFPNVCPVDLDACQVWFGGYCQGFIPRTKQ